MFAGAGIVGGYLCLGYLVLFGCVGICRLPFGLLFAWFVYWLMSIDECWGLSCVGVLGAFAYGLGDLPFVY